MNKVESLNASRPKFRMASRALILGQGLNQTKANRGFIKETIVQPTKGFNQIVFTKKTTRYVWLLGSRWPWPFKLGACGTTNLQDIGKIQNTNATVVHNNFTHQRRVRAFRSIDHRRRHHDHCVKTIIKQS